MNNWKLWKLIDKDGNVLAIGRKKYVMDKEYPRYVYGHIFTDTIIRTNESLYSYLYSITYIDKYGYSSKRSFINEADMFSAAVAVDNEGGELLTVYREVYERRDNVVRFIARQPYKYGVPQV